MLNIVVALKIWATCDNMAGVDVLTSGKTKHSTLALCACNIWLLSAIYNISIHIEHIPGKNNVVADLLSRFKFDTASWQSLQEYIQLTTSVFARLLKSSRPATQRAYSRMFSDFMAFLVMA